MTVPHQVTCVLRTSATELADGEKNLGKFETSQHEHLLLHEVSPSTTANKGAPCSPASTNSIFRPISKERSSFWSPPLYRNTTLRSTPSKSCSATLSSSSSCGDQDEEPNLPSDFVPPRHAFATSLSRDPLRDQGNTLSSPTHNATKLQSDDIVCGRGAPVNFHQGNIAYRQLIKQYETSYICAKRSDKPRIAIEVMDIIKSRGARFVRREKADCGMIWVQINEQRAYEKVCQSLRDGAPEMRRRMLAASMKAKSKETTMTENKLLFEEDSLFFREESYSPIPF